MAGLASLVLATLLFSGQGHAQSKRDKARQLAKQGVEAFKNGDYETALTLLQSAEALVHSPVHLLFRARAYRKRGDALKARKLYLKIVSEELPSGGNRAFANAQQDAAKELKALDPTIPRLTLLIRPKKIKGLKVEIDGDELHPDQVGVEFLVNPGRHIVHLTARGYLPATKKLHASMGGADEVVIRLKPDPDAKAALAPPPSAYDVEDDVKPSKKNPKEKPEPKKPAEPAAEGKVDTNMRAAAYGLFGLAAVGVGAGTIFYLQARDKEGEAEAICPGSVCRGSDREEVIRLDNEALQARQRALVGFVMVGGLSLAGGLGLLWLSGRDVRKAEERNRAFVQPYATPQEVGFVGRF